jgi:hypothetical protein
MTKVDFCMLGTWKSSGAVFLLVFFLVVGCTSREEYLNQFMVDVSEFTIDNSLLEDGDYVQILGSSGNLTPDDPINFYNLIVVISERTGDTINLLVTNYYMADLNNRRTRFISNSSVIGKIAESATEIDKLEGINVKDLKAKTFKKVFYDSEYIQVDVRRFPAVTGTLGYEIDGDFSEMN